MQRPMDLLLASLRWLMTGSCALVLCACYGNTTRPRAGYARAGRAVVVKDARHQALEGLLVTLHSAAGVLLASQRTDAAGSAQFWVPEAYGERLTLTVGDGDGCPFQKQQVGFQSRDPEPLQVTLEPKASPRGPGRP